MADLRSIDAIDKADDVVPTLERALAKAKEGNVSAVAICFVYRDGTTGQSWSYQRLTAMMVGCATILAHKLVEFMDSTYSTPPDAG